MSFVSRLFHDAANGPDGRTPEVTVDPRPLRDLFERELSTGDGENSPGLAQARVADLSRDLGHPVAPDATAWMASASVEERARIVAAVEVCRSHFVFPRLKDVSAIAVDAALRGSSRVVDAASAIEALLTTLGIAIRATEASVGEP